MPKEIAQIADSRLLNGEKLYLKRARITLPYLVRQAKAKKTIYYSDLANEIGIPNPRNLNYILGAIGKALIELGHANNVDIPPIQCLVINKNTELPGEGIGWFLNKEDFNKDFHKLTKSEKKEAVNMQLVRVFTFQKWDWVLKEFGLTSLKIDSKEQLEKAKKLHFGIGESEPHKKLKQFIAENPSAVGLDHNLKGDQEYILPSADKIDVVFTNRDLTIGIEVKSRVSDANDILRGLFQCVKYKYLIEAEQIVNGKKPNSRIILALENPFPPDLISIKNILGIEVIDGIKTTASE